MVRVPPKLMAGARRGARSFGKSDSIDALAIARAALGHPDLPVAVEDHEAREIKLLVDHRETLVRQRTEAQGRLRWLLHAVDPELSVPHGALDLKGCGALIAGKLIGETGGIGRFRTDAQLARLAGVAPLDASSGQQQRHRLNRHGNRQLNTALHKLAVVQGRWDPRARAYLERRQAEGKTRLEALRCLKRLLARVVFRLLRQAPTGVPSTSFKVRGGRVRVAALA